MNGTTRDSNVTARRELGTSEIVDMNLQELAEGSNMRLHVSSAQGPLNINPSHTGVSEGK